MILIIYYWSVKCQPHKMIKHTQTFRQQVALANILYWYKYP